MDYESLVDCFLCALVSLMHLWFSKWWLKHRWLVFLVPFLFLFWMQLIFEESYVYMNLILLKLNTILYYEVFISAVKSSCFCIYSLMKMIYFNWIEGLQYPGTLDCWKSLSVERRGLEMAQLAMEWMMVMIFTCGLGRVP